MNTLLKLFYEFIGYMLDGKATEKQFENFVAQFREKTEKVSETIKNAILEFLLKIKPSQFDSFEEIVETAGLNNGYYDWLKTNDKCRNAILTPISGGYEDEIFLYYEGKNQNIPGGKDIYVYFAKKGYEVIEKAHSSVLTNAMAQLTEEKLTELGIPSNVDIVLPTDEASLLPDEDGRLCFLEVGRHGGSRKLDLVLFGGGWAGNCAFLLRKKKV